MADAEVKPTWEVALVVGAGVIAAAIGVLMALDRANGAVFTALGLGAALLSLATAVLTRALASQPRRHQLMIGGGAVTGLVVLVGLGLLTFEPSDASSPANPRFTAQLVESGPFTQTLPRSLKFDGLAPAGIGEPSSAQKLTATQVVISDTGESGLNMFVWAHVEIYPEEGLARQRWLAKRHVLTQQYETGLDDLSEDSACVDEQMSWTCVATRGLAYAEVTLSPNDKVTLPTTIAVLQALLEYTDDQARQAS